MPVVFKPRDSADVVANPMDSASVTVSSRAASASGTSPTWQLQAKLPRLSNACFTRPAPPLPVFSFPFLPLPRSGAPAPPGVHFNAVPSTRWADMTSEADSLCSSKQARLHPDAPTFVPGAVCHIGLCQHFEKKGWCRFGDYCHQPHARHLHKPPLDLVRGARRTRRGGINSVQARAAKRVESQQATTVTAPPLF